MDAQVIIVMQIQMAILVQITIAILVLLDMNVQILITLDSMQISIAVFVVVETNQLKSPKQVRISRRILR